MNAVKDNADIANAVDNHVPSASSSTDEHIMDLEDEDLEFFSEEENIGEEDFDETSCGPPTTVEEADIPNNLYEEVKALNCYDSNLVLFMSFIHSFIHPSIDHSLNHSSFIHLQMYIKQSGNYN